MPSHKPEHQFQFGDRIRVNLHHGKIEDAVVRAVIQDGNETKLQVDVVGLDLAALIENQLTLSVDKARDGNLGRRPVSSYLL